jgi:hypothetical protein
LFARARQKYVVLLLNAGETVHVLVATFADRMTFVNPASVATCTSYEVAPETSLQSRTGDVATLVAPFAGVDSVGVVGNVHPPPTAKIKSS